MADPFPIAWLNGEFLPLGEARISPLDRGFLFADGVYEVVPVHRGRLFRLHVGGGLSVGWGTCGGRQAGKLGLEVGLCGDRSRGQRPGGDGLSATGAKCAK